MNQNPSPVKLDELDLSNLQARACNAVSLLVKSLRGPAPTHADLKTACGAANNAARNLNQLCAELFPADASEEKRKPSRRGGKGNTERRAADFERLAALEAENAELRTSSEKLVNLLCNINSRWKGYQNAEGVEVGGELDLAIAGTSAALAAKGGVA